MPSSTTRATNLEVRLWNHFRATYYRVNSLRHGGFPSDTLWLHFAALLDIEPNQLAANVVPKFSQDCYCTYQDYVADIDYWQSFGSKAGWSTDKVLGQGVAASLSDIAADLTSIGRADEAEAWCKMAIDWTDWAEHFF